VQPRDRPINDNLDVMASQLAEFADSRRHPQF
jgi:hypothetical protein